MTALTPEAELALSDRARSSQASERERAFVEVFEALRTQVFGICLHVTGNRSDAEDALQECFFAIHRGLAGFRGEARLSTWAYRVAVRSALAVKARRRHAHRPIDEAAHLSVDATGPEERAHARKESARLVGALEELPAEHRVVIALFAVDGLSHEQIAQILGVQRGTVWSRLHAARKRLAEILGRPSSS